MIKDLIQLNKRYKRNIIRYEFLLDPLGILFVLDNNCEERDIVVIKDTNEIIEAFEQALIDDMEKEKNLGSILIITPNEVDWAGFKSYIRNIHGNNKKSIRVGRVRYNKKEALKGENAKVGLTTDQAMQYCEDLPEIIKQENKELGAMPTYTSDKKEAICYWYDQAYKYRKINKIEMLFLMHDLEGFSKEDIYTMFRTCLELKIHTLEDVDKCLKKLHGKIKDAISFVQGTKTPLLTDYTKENKRKFKVWQ